MTLLYLLLCKYIRAYSHDFLFTDARQLLASVATNLRRFVHVRQRPSAVTRTDEKDLVNEKSLGAERNGNAMLARSNELEKPRVAVVRRNGDWDCEPCGNCNFGWRVSCNRCHQLRPSKTGT
jgi:hypothetical protein